jgi:hydrogenase maturation protein HypF
MAEAVISVAASLAEREGIADCCLSGGVFQNQILLALVEDGLRDRGLRVHRNVHLPPNDGGISFGQIVLASWRAFQGAVEPQGAARKAARARGR